MERNVFCAWLFLCNWWRWISVTPLCLIILDVRTIERKSFIRQFDWSGHAYGTTTSYISHRAGSHWWVLLAIYDSLPIRIPPSFKIFHRAWPCLNTIVPQTHFFLTPFMPAWQVTESHRGLIKVYPEKPEYVRKLAHQSRYCWPPYSLLLIGTRMTNFWGVCSLWRWTTKKYNHKTTPKQSSNPVSLNTPMNHYDTGSCSCKTSYHAPHRE